MFLHCYRMLIWSNTPAQAGSPGARSMGTYPGRFWISPILHAPFRYPYSLTACPHPSPLLPRLNSPSSLCLYSHERLVISLITFQTHIPEHIFFFFFFSDKTTNSAHLSYLSTAFNSKSQQIISSEWYITCTNSGMSKEEHKFSRIEYFKTNNHILHVWFSHSPLHI